MRHKVMMKCGHAANAVNGKGEPSCVICVGIDPGAEEVAESPNLEGRFATCSYGKHGRVPSDLGLAFFAYHPDKDEDEYYCGCYGWD